MIMYRHLIHKLASWNNSKKRKPLILKGSRQVGKTYLLKKFGENNFSNTHYFNFEKQLEVHQAFEESLDPRQIISNLSVQFT